MSGNVVRLPVITRLCVPVDTVLEGVNEHHATTPFKRVLVIGFDEDENEYFASSDPDGGTALWDLERCRYKLMKLTDGDD